MRALFLLPLVAACSGNAGFDFVEVHGSFAGGSKIDGHNLASVARVPSLQPALGTVLAVGSPFQGPEDLRGFRIEWVEAQIAAGQSYPSDPNGPVVFYVSRAVPDGGATGGGDAEVVMGGTVTFTQVSTKVLGTLSNLMLTSGGTNVTVDSGSFQATLPK